MAVMHAADLDGNGSIDYEEFIVSTVNLARLNKQARTPPCHMRLAPFSSWQSTSSCETSQAKAGVSPCLRMHRSRLCPA